MLSHQLTPNPLSQQGCILIEENVISRAFSFRQREPGQPEAGGILLGYRRGPHVHVVDLTVPLPGDRRSAFGFERLDAGHQAHATRRWQESARTIDYVGEWHTHPVTSPEPSTLDEREWSLISRSAREPMIFWILGRNLSHWLGVGAQGRLVRCSE